jgi:hypothetical protein
VGDGGGSAAVSFQQLRQRVMRPRALRLQADQPFEMGHGFVRLARCREDLGGEEPRIGMVAVSRQESLQAALAAGDVPLSPTEPGGLVFGGVADGFELLKGHLVPFGRRDRRDLTRMPRNGRRAPEPGDNA